MGGWLWMGMILVALAAGAATGQGDAVGQALLTQAREAVVLSLNLAGGYALWMGLLAIARRAGLVGRISRALRPLLRWLFPGVGDGETLEDISMNLTANFLGMGNAATPYGLKAMAGLKAANPQPERASGAMCMLLVINASSVQLIPATVLMLRGAAGSASPGDILLPAILTSAASTAAAVLLGRLMLRARP